MSSDSLDWSCASPSGVRNQLYDGVSLAWVRITSPDFSKRCSIGTSVPKLNRLLVISVKVFLIA